MLWAECLAPLPDKLQDISLSLSDFSIWCISFHLLLLVFVCFLVLFHFDLGFVVVVCLLWYYCRTVDLFVFLGSSGYLLSIIETQFLYIFTFITCPCPCYWMLIHMGLFLLYKEIISGLMCNKISSVKLLECTKNFCVLDIA